MKHVFAASLLLPALLLHVGNASAETGLTIEHARAVIAPFYDALNQPATKDVASLLEKATAPAWTTCGSETACLPREKLVPAFKARGEAVPDLKWEIKEVIVSGDKAIVRGEASGTPAKTFLGVEPTGKSFRIMSIDIQTIEGDKIVHSYHIEDWAGAVRQLTAK
jgi:predicted ester cyclase